MPETPNTDNSLVISYLSLRKAIGIIGITLPFVLVIGKNLLQSSGLLGSMSSYYYSVMGDVFVGSFCAIGVFLLSYHGYEKKDDIAGKIAGLSAIGLALFPTTPDIAASAQAIMIGKWHLFFALIFSLTLVYFSLFLFRKTNPNKQSTDMKKIRNIIYAVCGIIIFVCIALMGFVLFFPGNPWVKQLQNPIFWLETSSVIAFGISWFVKGEAILKDEN